MQFSLTEVAYTTLYELKNHYWSDNTNSCPLLSIIYNNLIFLDALLYILSRWSVVWKKFHNW